VFVVDVLIGAAAATAKVWALWRNAMRRAFFNIDKFCFGELVFVAHDLGGNGFAIDRIRDKDGFALFPSDAFSAESNVFDF